MLKSLNLLLNNGNNSNSGDNNNGDKVNGKDINNNGTKSLKNKLNNKETLEEVKNVTKDNKDWKKDKNNKMPL